MKYYLSVSLLHDLVLGDQPEKKRLQKSLAEIIKTNGFLYTSFYSLNILLKELPKEKRIEVLENVVALCDSILDSSEKELNHCLTLSREVLLEYDLLMELSTCINAGVRTILSTTDDFNLQNLIKHQKI
jgi:hypothetical protein